MNITSRLLMASWLLIFAIGCQPKVYLMPTPAVLATGGINPFAVNPNLRPDNLVPVFFATNRIPLLSDEFRQYTIFPDNYLHLGVARMRIGTKELPWEKLLFLSTTAAADKRPVLLLEEIDQMVS